MSYIKMHTWGRLWSRITWSYLGIISWFNGIIFSIKRSWIPEWSVQKSKNRSDVDERSVSIIWNSAYSSHMIVFSFVRDNLLKTQTKSNSKTNIDCMNESLLCWLFL